MKSRDCGALRMPARGCDGSLHDMSPEKAQLATHVGDWLETRGIHGEAARRGQIIEILGEPGREHYKVRWDEQHESIVYPADGVHITHRESR